MTTVEIHRMTDGMNMDQLANTITKMKGDLEYVQTIFQRRVKDGEKTSEMMKREAKKKAKLQGANQPSDSSPIPTPAQRSVQ